MRPQKIYDLSYCAINTVNSQFEPHARGIPNGSQIAGVDPQEFEKTAFFTAEADGSRTFFGQKTIARDYNRIMCFAAQDPTLPSYVVVPLGNGEWAKFSYKGPRNDVLIKAQADWLMLLHNLQRGRSAYAECRQAIQVALPPMITPRPTPEQLQGNEALRLLEDGRDAPTDLKSIEGWQRCGFGGDPVPGVTLVDYINSQVQLLSRVATASVGDVAARKQQLTLCANNLQRLKIAADQAMQAVKALEASHSPDPHLPVLRAKAEWCQKTVATALCTVQAHQNVLTVSNQPHNFLADPGVNWLNAPAGYMSQRVQALDMELVRLQGEQSDLHEDTKRNLSKTAQKMREKLTGPWSNMSAQEIQTESNTLMDGLVTYDGQPQAVAAAVNPAATAVPQPVVTTTMTIPKDQAILDKLKNPTELQALNTRLKTNFQLDKISDDQKTVELVDPKKQVRALVKEEPTTDGQSVVRSLAVQYNGNQPATTSSADYIAIAINATHLVLQGVDKAHPVKLGGTDAHLMCVAAITACLLGYKLELDYPAGIPTEAAHLVQLNSLTDPQREALRQWLVAPAEAKPALQAPLNTLLDGTKIANVSSVAHQAEFAKQFPVSILLTQTAPVQVVAGGVNSSQPPVVPNGSTDGRQRLQGDQEVARAAQRQPGEVAVPPVLGAGAAVIHNERGEVIDSRQPPVPPPVVDLLDANAQPGAPVLPFNLNQPPAPNALDQDQPVNPRPAEDPWQAWLQAYFQRAGIDIPAGADPLKDHWGLLVQGFQHAMAAGNDTNARRDQLHFAKMMADQYHRPPVSVRARTHINGMNDNALLEWATTRAAETVALRTLLEGAHILGVGERATENLMADRTLLLQGLCYARAAGYNDARLHLGVLLKTHHSDRAENHAGRIRLEGEDLHDWAKAQADEHETAWLHRYLQNAQILAADAAPDLGLANNPDFLVRGFRHAMNARDNFAASQLAALLRVYHNRFVAPEGARLPAMGGNDLLTWATGYAAVGGQLAPDHGQPNPPIVHHNLPHEEPLNGGGVDLLVAGDGAPIAFDVDDEEIGAGDLNVVNPAPVNGDIVQDLIDLGAADDAQPNVDHNAAVDHMNDPGYHVGVEEIIDLPHQPIINQPPVPPNALGNAQIGDLDLVALYAANPAHPANGGDANHEDAEWVRAYCQTHEIQIPPAQQDNDAELLNNADILLQGFHNAAMFSLDEAEEGIFAELLWRCWNNGAPVPAQVDGNDFDVVQWAMAEVVNVARNYLQDAGVAEADLHADAFLKNRDLLAQGLVHAAEPRNVVKEHLFAQLLQQQYNHGRELEDMNFLRGNELINWAYRYIQPHQDDDFSDDGSERPSSFAWSDDESVVGDHEEPERDLNALLVAADQRLSEADNMQAAFDADADLNDEAAANPLQPDGRDMPPVARGAAPRPAHQPAGLNNIAASPPNGLERVAAFFRRGNQQAPHKDPQIVNLDQDTDDLRL